DTFLFRNRGLAEIRGGEVELRFHMGAGLIVDVTGQSGRGLANDDSAALDDIAPRSLVLQVRKTFGGGVFVSARAAAFARDSAPGPSEVVTPGYVDAGATGGWRLGRGLELRVAAANLLNQKYYSSPSSRAVLAPGRNATLTAVLKY